MVEVSLIGLCYKPMGAFMSALLFDLKPAITLPVTGETAHFPINRIFCVGRNYAAHAAEMGDVVDKQTPFYFTVAPINAALGGKVAIASGTADYHHEVEFVVALGKGGRDISQADALSCVYGYGVGLDMTRRDLQNIAKDKRRPWDISKDVEASAILSSLIKADAFGAVGTQAITLSKNDEMVQSSDLSQMVHSVPELIAHLSQFYELTAGDIIMTGTPEGVGPVERGDRLVAQVFGTPTLDVTFI